MTGSAWHGTVCLWALAGVLTLKPTIEKGEQDMTTKSSGHSWVIDSMEENSAAVEQDGSTVFQIPRSLLPAGAREGDHLKVSPIDSGEGRELRITIQLDHDATQAARQRSAAQVAPSVQSRDPGGHIKL